MGVLTEVELTDRTEEILEDGTSNLIFTVPLIKSQLQDGLSEMSQIVANEVKHIINVSDDSRDLDLSTITGLNDIDDIEYPVDKWPRVFRNFNYWGDTAELEIDNKPTASSLGSLTGTVTFSTDSTAISGSGTKFTTELEEGWYIKKSSSSTWHRISTITDDTNLILVSNVDSADNGADTAGATNYWYQYAYLYCRKVHYLSQLTDLLGAIDLTAGYAKGAMLIHIDDLQASGTIKKNTVLTIAGVSGSYRVTADATIASNECDVKISPSLSGDVGDDAVVTIRSSSLSSELERILPELSAGRVAKNWVGNLRTQINTSITVTDLANAEIDKITDRITQIRDTDIPAARNAVNAKLTEAQAAIVLAKAQADAAVIQAIALKDEIGDKTGAAEEVITAIELGNTYLDEAIEDVTNATTSMEKDLDDNDAAMDAALADINAELDLGNIAIDSIDAFVNKVTIGGDPVGKRRAEASGRIQLAMSRVSEARALAAQKSRYRQLALTKLELTKAAMLEAQIYATLEGQITRENALSVQSYVQSAQGYAREANAYMRSDAQQVASYGRVVQQELSTIQAEVSQAGGYFREASSRLRITPAINALLRWANEKIAQAQSDLRMIAPPRQKQYGLPTS